MTTPKIAKAADSTDEVQEHVGKALSILQPGFNGRIVNGWGIYSDVSNRTRDLAAAIEELQKALEVMRITAWPTKADYPENG